MLLMAAVAGVFDDASAQLPIYFDDEVKAAFLYHFGTYVEWPEARDVTTIAVLGADPIARQLMRFLPGKTIRGRPVEVRPLGHVDELGEDEILFVGRSFNDSLEEIIDAVAMRPVLIVTDAPNGLGAGATINFRIVENRVRFEVSLAAAEQARLSMSSRLLAAALRVEQPP